jgi:hypothetical protein
LVGLLENPLDEQLHTADASIETASGPATRIDPFDVGGGEVRGRVVLVPTGIPVSDGVVIITAQPRGHS